MGVTPVKRDVLGSSLVKGVTQKNLTNGRKKGHWMWVPMVGKNSKEHF